MCNRKGLNMFKNIKIGKILETVVISFFVINFIFLLGDSFGLFDKPEVEKEYSNGDTRIETYSESNYDISGWSGHQEQWEEVYYNGEWILREEYDKIMEETEYKDEYAWEYEPIYFLPNGYYYHSTKECKGLEGCDNIQEDIFGNISVYKNLDACNWCN